MQKPLNMFVELLSRSNMRFLKFQESDFVASMNTESAPLFMFRPAFISGYSFSPSMLNTLLWQVHCCSSSYLATFLPSSPLIQASAPSRMESHVAIFQHMVGCAGTKADACIGSHALTTAFLLSNDITTYGELCRYFIQNEDAIPFGVLPTSRSSSFLHCLL